MNNFGTRLRELREARGLSQKRLAELIDGEPMQISRYEAGTNLPAAESIVRLSQVLRISIDELLTGEKPRLDPLAADIHNLDLLDRFRLVDRLPKGDQQTAISLLDGLVAKHELSAVLGRMQRSA